MTAKNIDRISYQHPHMELQDAIEYLETETNFIVDEATPEEKSTGLKHHLLQYTGDGKQGGYDDMGFMSDAQIIEFAREKGFGIFQNIDLDAIINDEAKKCEHLECDGTVRVLHYMLDSHKVPHYVFKGTLEINSKVLPVHFWIGLPDGRLVDFKARMWFGNDAPNGIFYPKDVPAIYVGKPIAMDVSATLYKLLLHVV